MSKVVFGGLLINAGEAQKGSRDVANPCSPNGQQGWCDPSRGGPLDSHERHAARPLAASSVVVAPSSSPGRPTPRVGGLGAWLVEG